MAGDDTERTEEPTPERRKKARDEGQFPRAKDAGNIIASVVVMLTLAAIGRAKQVLLLMTGPDKLARLEAARSGAQPAPVAQLWQPPLRSPDVFWAL